MTRAEKYIRHYNRLNGKPINKSKLAKFFNKLNGDIKSGRIDAHMAYGLECIEVEKRIGKALSAMNGTYNFVERLEVKPIKIMNYAAIESKMKRPEKKKEAPAPKKETKVVEDTKTKREHKSPLPPTERDVSSQAAPVSSKKTHKLSGVVDASQIAKMNFNKINLDGKYKNEFGCLYSDTQMMFWGPPGGGKTVWLLQFAQYLAEKGLNTLYLANEEMGRSTFTDKIRQFNIGNKKLKFAKNMRDISASGMTIEDFDAIFFDSVQSLGMELSTYKKFVEDHPGHLYVLIIQSTKDGDFRGGKDWEHEVDIAGEIRNRKLILRKNRLDSDFTKKAEKLEMEEIINDRKKSDLIKEKLKQKTEKP